MGALLYFVPGAKAPVTRAHLVEWGLDRLFEGMPYHADSAGPQGHGVLLCDAPALEPYQPIYTAAAADQEWRVRPAKYGPEVWVGRFVAADRPTPAELDRPTMVAGTRVQLADGHWWLVPKVRSTTPEGREYSPLPSYVELDEEGKPQRGPIDERYRTIWDVTAAWWNAFLAAINDLPGDAESMSVVVPDEYLFDAAATLLATNYRVDPFACDRLRLFMSTGHMADVLWAACDCDFALAALLLQKKTNGSR